MQQLDASGAHIYFKAYDNTFRALIASGGVILPQLNTVCEQTCTLWHVCL